MKIVEVNCIGATRKFTFLMVYSWSPLAGHFSFISCTQGSHTFDGVSFSVFMNETSCLLPEVSHTAACPQHAC